VTASAHTKQEKEDSSVLVRRRRRGGRSPVPTRSDTMRSVPRWVASGGAGTWVGGCDPRGYKGRCGVGDKNIAILAETLPKLRFL
jgi:hypothetical protein